MSLRARWLGPLIFVMVAPLPAVRAEVMKTLRAEMRGAATRPVGVENLLGTMRVTVGATDALIVVATVHAQDDALASSVRLEEVRGDGGVATLRVRYPATSRVLHYPRRHGDVGWNGFPFFGDSNTERYDGRRYRVSSRHGTLLYADVEVQLPARIAAATFFEPVGELEAAGLEGKLSFRVESADLRLDRLRGEVEANGTSGDTRASHISGTWRSEFSSGDCEIERFDGSSATFHTSSGDIAGRGIVAERLSIESSSGDARIRDADVREIEAHASSGDLSFAFTGSRLARVRAEASSGDVHLALAPDAAFHAEGDQSSGEMRVRFEDGERRYRRGDLVSFRRGSGGAEIRVTTSSGDFTIDPR
jgi:Putative adhesin